MYNVFTKVSDKYLTKKSKEFFIMSNVRFTSVISPGLVLRFKSYTLYGRERRLGFMAYRPLKFFFFKQSPVNV